MQIVEADEKMSQCEIILKHLQKNPEGITPLDALNYYGIMRLGARVWDLKAEGHDIKTETVRKKRGKKNIQYARYILKEATV